MKEAIRLIVNGTEHDLQLEPTTPLLYVLRNQLRLNGPKFGCGLGQCGSCMVLLDGEAVPSCVVTAASAVGRQITTLEGLTRPDGSLHPLQAAFVDEQAAQCGYCLNGMIVAAAALLGREAEPDEAAIRTGLQGNLCRCGTHARILRAVQRAADTMNS